VEDILVSNCRCAVLGWQAGDSWDAAEERYSRLPVLKWLMRGLARQAAAPL
jgi:hypothetical protein